MTRHVCEVEVTFPTNLQAKQALRVLQVDQEPSDRVTRSFELVTVQHDDSNMVGDGNDVSMMDDDENFNDNSSNVVTSMKVRFESEELKMLRVSVSSFYDYLTVVLKTFQEFDESV